MEYESIFVKTFGKSPIVKVLDFIVGNDMFDYPKTEVAGKTGISRDTLNKLWPNLVESGIIKKTRSVSNVDMYSIDKDNPIAQKLIELDFALSSKFADEEIERHSKKVGVTG